MMRTNIVVYIVFNKSNGCYKNINSSIKKISEINITFSWLKINSYKVPYNLILTTIIDKILSEKQEIILNHTLPYQKQIELSFINTLINCGIVVILTDLIIKKKNNNIIYIHKRRWCQWMVSLLKPVKMNFLHYFFELRFLPIYFVWIVDKVLLNTKKY